MIEGSPTRSQQDEGIKNYYERTMSYCSGTQIYDKGLGIGFRVRQVTTRVLSVCIRTNIRVRGYYMATTMPLSKD